MSGRAGLYLRLSREDGEQESQSIDSQRALLTRYAGERGLSVAEVYIDDGWSGTTFDRPGFRRMLADIEAGRLDTVLTKDLSRLGRDYIQTGYYIERYFPAHGVRYIAVGDHIDTEAEDGTLRLAPFLNVINDLYAADISRKVRLALTARRKAGRFIGAYAPYGYWKGEGGRLLIDPETAPHVRKLYRDFLAHGSVLGTAKRMTEWGILTPSDRRQGSGVGERTHGVWSEQTVRRILTNPTYAGHLTQNRSRKRSHKLEQRVRLPPSEWITVPHTHEAIVSQREFDCVQNILAARRYQRSGGEGHLLTGLAFCADCGAPMTYVRESETRTYLVCQGYRKGGRLHLCTGHWVREDRLFEQLRQVLTDLADAAGIEGRQFEPLNRIAAAALIRRVLVHEDRRIEVFFRFRPPEAAGKFCIEYSRKV
ncbi:MAG: recombinase family protein [Oscillospiraceae bacterium]|nr:recombinase family protein [Oscillospiraceae bacterium]